MSLDNNIANATVTNNNNQPPGNALILLNLIAIVYQYQFVLVFKVTMLQFLLKATESKLGNGNENVFLYVKIFKALCHFLYC